MNKASVGARVTTRASRRTSVVVRAVDTHLVVSGATLAMLAVGRFAFMPYQRRELSKSLNVSGPKTTGNWTV
jgi:photosystem I subunit V